MLLLVLIHTACNFYVAYRGHAMGAMMESDLRSELFDHYQKLSFRFYDDQRTGELMSRITNDLFLLSELYHHGPEDLLIYSVKFIGAFVILLKINVPLTLAVFRLCTLHGGVRGCISIKRLTLPSAELGADRGYQCPGGGHPFRHPGGEIVCQ